MNYPMALVHWLDHETNGGPGWESLEDQLEWAEEPVAVGRTVGWIIYENDTYIVLVDTFMDGGSVGAAHKIVKGDIIYRKELDDGRQETGGTSGPPNQLGNQLPPDGLI